MSFTIPTREQAIEYARDLIASKRSPEEVAAWAAQIDLPGNESADEHLSREDPLLRSFLDDLQLAPQLGAGDALLYTTKDFQSWLDEFVEAVKTENRQL